MGSRHTRNALRGRRDLRLYQTVGSGLYLVIGKTATPDPPTLAPTVVSHSLLSGIKISWRFRDFDQLRYKLGSMRYQNAPNTFLNMFIRS